MDPKVKWRTIWLGLLVVFAICSLVPTVAPESAPGWFSSLFSRKVKLGLDLQGGWHVVYSVDLDKAVDDKASEIKRDLDVRIEEINKEAAKAKKPEDKIEAAVTTPLSPVGAVTVTAKDAASFARLDDDLFAEYVEVVNKRICPPEQQELSRCFRVSGDYAERIKSSALEQAINTIRDRIDERGVASASVVKKGDDIIVELPGLDEESIQRVKTLIRRTAKLEFKMVDNDTEYMKKLTRHVAQDPKAKEAGVEFETDRWVHDESGQVFNDTMLRAKDVRRYVPEAEARQRGCYSSDKAQKGSKFECTIPGRAIMREYLEALFQEKPELKPDDNHEIAFEEVPPRKVDETAMPTWRSYFLHRAVELSGTEVSQATVFWNPTTGRPEVWVNFTRYGGERFRVMTGKNVGKKMAIILDEKVNSAPIIQTEIGGGASTITMGGNEPTVMENEAKDLVNVLRTGSLPAPLKEETSSIVGPLLGRDAVDKAKFSFLVGSILVILIMVAYYRTAGVISIVALVINILLMMAALAAFGATLTLPGIAALVLTVGMAVDANIIVYERIREELRAGKSVRGAVDAGFKHGFSAIVDGQLTTAVAAYVLYNYGSGPIRGFATMLLIGIACTLFTAYWCTRLFFEHYVGRGRKAAMISI